MNRPIFHLAIPTHDLSESRRFYEELMGFSVGRSYPDYVIYDFSGHQLVTHLKPNEICKKPAMYPRHFGLIFESKKDFDALYKRCKEKKAPFFEDLFERFKEKKGWHWSFFVHDFSNNLLEMKYYVNPEDIC